MTIPFVGVSLKMYFDHERTVTWSGEVAGLARGHRAVREGAAELVILPSFPSLAAAGERLLPAGVRLGAQDLAEQDAGPYTGDVSGASLQQLGCGYVEIGHAERRALHGEDDAVAARKVAAARRHGLVPLLCVGEEARGEARRAGEHCVRQAEAALAETDEPTDLVVAYEPVWAIGSTEAASPEHIAIVTRALRAALTGHPRVGTVRVIYGGSAGPGLLTRLGDAVDGLFLGRFAHDVCALGSVLDETLARS